MRVKSILKKSGLAVAALLSGVTLYPAQAQVNVLTQHNDNARTGANLQETTLNTANVTPTGFGKLFSRVVDSKIWTQPLVLNGVNVPNLGVRNLVYVGTENASMYAFDADDATRTQPIWRVNLAEGYTSNYKGIVGTPVIDPARNTIWMVCKMRGADGKHFFRLNALDVATGAHKAGSPKLITASVPGTGLGSVNGTLSFDPDLARQRPGLLLQGNRLLLSFGATSMELPGDIYHGWIMTYDAVTLQQTAVWCGAPNGLGATLWASGQGPAADAAGNVYVMTGNGTFSAATGGKDYGDSFLRFAPNSLNVASYFTPWDEKNMERYDQDLGSAGPMLIPNSNLLVAAGKKGWIYLVDRTNMGGHRTDNDSQIVQTFGAFNGHLHGSLVYWNTPNRGPMIYGWSEEDFLKAFRFANGRLDTTPTMRGPVTAPPGMPGGFLSISAYGSSPGTGILWAFLPFSGDANQGDVPGVLRAFDASDISKELWNSQQDATRDSLGTYAKFNYPTVANGKVYVPTFSFRLQVYGLLQAPAKPAAPTNLRATPGDAQVRLDWNAVPNAAYYSLKRATAQAGPFTDVAPRLSNIAYVNTGLTNGTTYYYKVTASNSAGESLDSNVVAATPTAAVAPPPARAISIDFVGGGPNGTPAPMAATEKAGIVPATHWNIASGSNGTVNALAENGGAATNASATWSASGTWSLTTTEAAGNARMMKGYLNTSNTSTTTVSVSNLPSLYTTNGYHIYIYTDGANAAANRTGIFKMGTVTVNCTDAANAQFSGNFVFGNNANGNYVKFANLSSSGFTLTATPGASTDTSPRAPINGLQIVPRAFPSTPPALAITSPANNAIVTSFTQVTGTASDQNGSGLYRVEAAIERLKSDGVNYDYWNGTQWVAAIVYLPATYTASTGAWSLPGLPTGAMLLDGKYRIRARAVDNSSLSTVKLHAFTLDRTAPAVIISTPANNTTISALTEIRGSLTELGSGIDRVDVVIRRVSDNKRWSYTTWVDFETGIAATVTGNTWSCTQNLPSGTDLADGAYVIKAVAFDKANNAGVQSVNVTVQKPLAAMMAQRSTKSEITISRLWAKSDEDALSVVFTGRLSEDALSDKNKFTITVNGRSMPLEGMSYDPDSNNLLLVLDPGALKDGDTVTLTWPALLDAQGRTIAAGTMTTVAE